MIELIQDAWNRWNQVANGYIGQWGDETRNFLVNIFSVKAFTMSFRFAPLPRLFEYLLDFAFATFDLFAQLLGIAPFLSIASTLADRIKIPGELRKRVMTLDQVALVPVRVIVKEGFETITNPTPNEFNLYKTIDRYVKISKFINAPSWKTGWRALAGSVWSRVVLVVFYVFTFGKMVGMIIVLWNYGKKIQDPNFWPLYFGGALPQDNPREKQRVKIYRRVGGVPP